MAFTNGRRITVKLNHSVASAPRIPTCLRHFHGLPTLFQLVFGKGCFVASRQLRGQVHSSARAVENYWQLSRRGSGLRTSWSRRWKGSNIHRGYWCNTAVQLQGCLPRNHPRLRPGPRSLSVPATESSPNLYVRGRALPHYRPRAVLPASSNGSTVGGIATLPGQLHRPGLAVQPRRERIPHPGRCQMSSGECSG